MPTEQEIQKIIELYNNGNGLSQGQIAKEFKRSKSTIHEWLKGLGLLESNGSNERSQTKRATEVKRTYDRARRLELNDKLFEKLELLLEDKVTARDYKDLMISYGILEDKRSLLEPPQVDSMSSGLAEMREAIHEERLNGLESTAENLQSG